MEEPLKRDIAKSYAQQLEDPRWYEFTRRIKAQRCHKCQDCASESNLEVHHLGYRAGAAAWEYEDHEVRLLCAPCHREVHAWADMVWNQLLQSTNKWAIYEAGKAALNSLDQHRFKILRKAVG